MRIWRETGRLAASVALVGIGLVAGLAISQIDPAVGIESQSSRAEATPAAAPSGSAAARLPQMVPQGSFVQVAEDVGPAVVFISTEIPVSVRAEGPHDFRGPFDDFFRRFFDDFREEERPRQEPGEEERGEGDAPDDQVLQSTQGSGILVSEDGYVLTNAHVVSYVNQDAQETVTAETIEVTLSNNDQYEASVVGIDLATDVAVLKLAAGSGLPAANLGDSDSVRVGEWVLAMGAPFSLRNTVSAGIISATGRAVAGLGTTTYQDFIQTDAAINRGNSGGPLVNLDGEVVGMNTAIITNNRSAMFSGVGFAVPINLARRVMDQLIEHGRVVRGYIGVSVQPEVPRDMAEAMGLDPDTVGVPIVGVTPGQPGAEAGLQPGDVVIGLNGTALESQQDFLQRVAQHAPGDTITLEVVHRNGEREEIEVTLTERPPEEEILPGSQAGPDSGPQQQEQQRGAAEFEDVGMRVVNLTPRIARQLGYEDEEYGVVVEGVRRGSPAQRAGLQQGVLLLEASRTPLQDVGDLERVIEETGAGGSVLLFVRTPPGQYLYVTLELPE